MRLIDRSLQHPDRAMVRFQPLKALGHFRKLVADKEDTEQVFHIIEATAGRKSARQAAAFVKSPDGQRLLAKGNDLPPMLDDHDRWADCAPNSVAAHYMAFMRREGLTAAGLVAESHKFKPLEDRHEDLYEWYFDRLRDTHDLFHVLTGYGRDALGETALLGFSYSQNHNKGILFIAYAGAREIKNDSGTAAPIYGAINEGRRLGRACAKLAHQDVEALMREDIDEARARLNLGRPETYFQCLDMMKSEGVGPEQVMSGGAAQA